MGGGGCCNFSGFFFIIGMLFIVLLTSSSPGGKLLVGVIASLSEGETELVVVTGVIMLGDNSVLVGEDVSLDVLFNGR
jgi:hypothetical protein